MKDKQEREIQYQYYTQTAECYDKKHLDIEYILAVHILAAYIEFYNIKTVLDVGAGTGKTVHWLKNRFPNLVVKGIEPVKALREQGYKKGISHQDLIDGDAYQLAFPDNTFYLVCEFAILHHVKEPEKVIHEMSRVASKMVAISDVNFMGQGSLVLRWLKFAIFFLGLWSLANYFKTKGKGYTLSKGDGLAYSYSVYQSLRTLNRSWQTLRLHSTKGKSDTFFGSFISAEHLLIIAHTKT